MPTYRYDELAVAHPSPTTERRLVYSDHLMMVSVDFSGGPTPPAPAHSHPHEQVTYIAQGPINFIIGEGDEAQVSRLTTGDMVVIPPDVPHTVEVLAGTARLIDCFYPIREDFLD